MTPSEASRWCVEHRGYVVTVDDRAYEIVGVNGQTAIVRSVDDAEARGIGVSRVVRAFVAENGAAFNS